MTIVDQPIQHIVVERLEGGGWRLTCALPGCEGGPQDFDEDDQAAMATWADTHATH